MSFDSDSIEFGKMSTKKLAILFGLVFAGAILLIQFIQGFPIKDLFQGSRTEVASISAKYDQTCIVTPSDERPREIHNCPYTEGENLTITFNPNSAEILTYSNTTK